MAHTHAGNEADFLKHVVLADLLEGLGRRFKRVRYVDPFAGEGLFHAPATAWTPPGDHPKASRFRQVQPAHPSVYLGSPLVAARALASAGRVRFELADEDADAARALRALTAAPAAAASTPRLPALTRVECRRFDPEVLASGEPGEATAVLLDPTWPDGYAQALAATLARAAAFLGPVAVVAWGLESWGLGAPFAQRGVAAARAAFSGRFASEVWIGALGPGHNAVESLARRAVAGW